MALTDAVSNEGSNRFTSADGNEFEDDYDYEDDEDDDVDVEEDNTDLDSFVEELDEDDGGEEVNDADLADVNDDDDDDDDDGDDDDNDDDGAESSGSSTLHPRRTRNSIVFSFTLPAAEAAELAERLMTMKAENESKVVVQRSKKRKKPAHQASSHTVKAKIALSHGKKVFEKKLSAGHKDPPTPRTFGKSVQPVTPSATPRFGPKL